MALMDAWLGSGRPLAASGKTLAAHARKGRLLRAGTSFTRASSILLLVWHPPQAELAPLFLLHSVGTSGALAPSAAKFTGGVTDVFEHIATEIFTLRLLLRPTSAGVSTAAIHLPIRASPLASVFTIAYWHKVRRGRLQGLPCSSHCCSACFDCRRDSRPRCVYDRLTNRCGSMRAVVTGGGRTAGPTVSTSQLRGTGLGRVHPAVDVEVGSLIVPTRHMRGKGHRIITSIIS